MGSVCAGGENEANNTFRPDGENNLSNGPVKNRSCTDILFVPLFVAAQFVWLIVTIIGVADGDPTKLYKPRDYRGAYCGSPENWNSGPNTENMPKLTYTMNITSTADVIMKQMLCSSGVANIMRSTVGTVLADQEELDNYLCDCCIAPCKKCEGAMDNGGDLTNVADIASTISARMKELTDPNKASELFSPSGANADMFSSDKFWSAATQYFNPVCLKTCQPSTATTRAFKYTPPPDSEYYTYWMKLNASADSNTQVGAVVNTMSDAFTFQALSPEECPYTDASVCIPFPGIKLSELGATGDYCTFEMAADVVDAVGSAAASAFTSIGLDSFSGAATESFGKLMGDIEESMDTFVIVGVLSFAVGLTFLVLLRFFIGACVWLAVVITILMFFFGGFFLFILSGQCEGASIFDTGHQAAVAVVVAGVTKVQDTVNGGETPSEALTGEFGKDYEGRQQWTRFGKKCLTWDTQQVMPWYNSTNYEAITDTSKNYCRNPFNEDDANKAKTIWCITTDPDVPWEECIPIGVLQPECAHGYAVSSETSRDILFYSCFVVWGLGVLWTILVFFMVNRIRLAIALNKVGAVYLGMNPTTLLIPVVQAVCAIVWCLVWFAGASFLLSQVPDSYTPKGAYATYDEAFGTDAVAGKCTDKWPTGGVWKTNNIDECMVEDGITKCWKCSPPRYIFDVRFAISFFVFLWNNAFNVALGQMLIAMAVSLWFFSSSKATTFVVKDAVKTVLRYHIGTVAFGSFIVAVVQFIRYLMKYFEKQAAAQKNKVMVFVLRAVQCCIWCFEKCIKFLNKNAYIQTALMGTNFCTSAKKAFYLILRNALRFGTMAVLGSVIYGIGLFSIMAGTGVIGYLLMRTMHSDVSPFMPILLFLMMSYVVAKLYMNVFGLAVDTCLQCFLAVEEMGTGQDFIPSELSNFVSSNGRKLEDRDAKPPQPQ